MYSYVDVNLTEGQHTIRYMVNETAPRNSSMYITALDFMLIMPTSYTWTPSITERPVKPLPKFTSEEFAIGGTVADGQTVTAEATVTRNDGESGIINLILAVYDSDNQMVAVDICEKTVGKYQHFLNLERTILLRFRQTVMPE